MAASAWIVYDTFRRFIGDGTLNLSTVGNFHLHLFTSAATTNITNAALSTLGSISDEVANANGYLISGRTMLQSWSIGDSAGQQRFDMGDLIWTATGGTIPNIRYALIVAQTGASGQDPLNVICMRAALTTAQFTLQQASTLTVSTPATDGIFELSGGG